MTITPESEIKLTLNESEWMALFRAGGGNPALIAPYEEGEIRVRPLGWHINYYFDQEDRLEAHGATLRLRPTDGKGPTYTLKVLRDPAADGARCCLEVAWPLNGFSIPAFLEVAQLPQEARDALAPLGVTTGLLPRLGRLETLRIEMMGGKVFLDRCELPNGAMLFEVEIESEDAEERAQLLERIRDICPSATQDSTSKYERFKAALRG